MPKRCYKHVSGFTGENEARSSVCVCWSSSPFLPPCFLQKPIYHHPIVEFQSSTQQPSTLPDYLQKNRSADGIQYNSLLPKKCSKKTTSTMLIHPPTLSSIIMGSVENYSKKSGKRSMIQEIHPKNSTEPWWEVRVSNPFEKICASQIGSWNPKGQGENSTYLKPPPRLYYLDVAGS